MGFQSTQSAYKATLQAPFYGMSAQAVATPAMVLALSGRFPSPISVTQDFTLNAPIASGLYMYFASPVSYGLVQFLDVESTFIGGWDGAQDNPYDLYGPITLNITIPSGVIVPFYVYRTDYSELGSVNWRSSPLV